MQKQKQIIAIIASLTIFVGHAYALPLTSTSYKIDVNTFDGGGTVSESSSYKLNNTVLGTFGGGKQTSSSYALDTGLVNLELYCGNGIVEFGEACDDGNQVSNDGCTSACVNEICGDSIIQSGIGEQCDDGNTSSGDGCSATCQTETTTTPPPSGGGSGGGGGQGGGGGGSICGNGFQTGSEQCDDGNNLNGDGCSSICTLETFYIAECGNHRLDVGEQCDDGNTSSGDGCSNQCLLEDEDGDETTPEDEDDLLPSADEEEPTEEEVDEDESPIIGPVRTLTIKTRPEKRVNAPQNWGVGTKLTFFNRTIGRTTLVTEVGINNIGWSEVTSNKFPNGVYDIALKGRSHLTKILRDVTIDENTRILDFTFGETQYLIAGDVHESKDDFINGLDISATVERLYQDNIDADLNNDGIVNGLDISIVVRNLYKSGERL